MAEPRSGPSDLPAFSLVAGPGNACGAAAPLVMLLLAVGPEPELEVLAVRQDHALGGEPPVVLVSMGDLRLILSAEQAIAEADALVEHISRYDPLFNRSLIVRTRLRQAAERVGVHLARTPGEQMAGVGAP